MKSEPLVSCHTSELPFSVSRQVAPFDYWESVRYDLPSQEVIYAECGTIKGKYECECGNVEAVPYNCGRIECPVCSKYQLARQARKATRRIAKGLHLGVYPNHVVLSPPADLAGEISPEKMHSLGLAYAKRLGLLGGVYVFHPFRFRALSDGRAIGWKHCSLNPEAESPVVPSEAYYAPHFHILAYGWLTKSTRYYRETGWVYKNLHGRKSSGEIYGTLYYILSHAGHQRGKLAVRYFGVFSNNQLRVSVDMTVIRPVMCEHCGLQMMYVPTLPTVDNPRCESEPGYQKLRVTRFVWRTGIGLARFAKWVLHPVR